MSDAGTSNRNYQSYNLKNEVMSQSHGNETDFEMIEHTERHENILNDSHSGTDGSRELSQKQQKEQHSEHHESTDQSIANSGKFVRAAPTPSVMEKTIRNNEEQNLMKEQANKNDDEATQYSIGSESKFVREKQSISSRYSRQSQQNGSEQERVSHGRTERNIGINPQLEDKANTESVEGTNMPLGSQRSLQEEF